MSKCPTTEPAAMYSQGSSNPCLNSSAALQGIVTDQGVLKNPGDWLLVMKPGFNADCLKCCDKGSYPAKIHQVCPSTASNGSQKENYVATPDHGTLLEMAATSGGSFDGCKYSGGCYRYGYLSSEMSKAGIKELKFTTDTCLTEKNSLVMQTLMSCGPQDGYVCWNDQQQSKPSWQFGKPNAGSSAYRCQENFTMTASDSKETLGSCYWADRDCQNLDAHDKGFIMFNKDIAVMCNHSCPSWPAWTGGNAPSCFSSSYMANLYSKTFKAGGGLGTGPGQFILYTVMSAKQMDEIIPKAWTLAQVAFQDSYIPKNLQSVYPATWSLLTSVFMQVPAQPNAQGQGVGVECMVSMSGSPPGGVDGSEYRNLCKYVDGVYDRDKRIKSKDDCVGKVPWCDKNACTFSTSFGKSSCKPNQISCTGSSNSWTNWQILGKKGDYSAGKVQVWNISDTHKVLAKSGYLMNGRADTWTDVIAPVINSNVIGTSWDMQYGSCYTSSQNGKKYSGADFSYFTNPNATSSTDSSRIKKIGCAQQEGFVSDHSKLCIATSNNWCAIGGLNRSKNGINPGDSDSQADYSQLCRGTLFTLIDDANLHNALRLWLGLPQSTLQNFKGCTSSASQAALGDGQVKTIVDKDRLPFILSSVIFVILIVVLFFLRHPS